MIFLFNYYCILKFFVVYKKFIFFLLNFLLLKKNFINYLSFLIIKSNLIKILRKKRNKIYVKIKIKNKEFFFFMFDYIEYFLDFKFIDYKYFLIARIFRLF